MVCIEQKQAYFDFINKELDAGFSTDQYCVCFASLGREGEIIGVVVFSGFTEYDCHISVASSSPKFLTKKLLDVIFHYAFITSAKRRVTAIVEDGNTKAIDMNLRLGFIRESVAKHWYGNKDGIVLRMLREECKWV